MKKKILVVDDTKDICRTIKQYLEIFDFDVHVSYNALQSLSEIRDVYDLLILDVMMDDLDGVELCTIIRDKISCPIIFVSANTTEETKIRALACGGDDYICKPFSLRELKARIDSHIRRESRIKSNTQQLLSSKNVSIDILGNTVHVKGTKLNLTTKEYQVLKLLMLNINIVFSKERIFETIWGVESESSLGSVSECVKNIRKKIKVYDPDTSYIKTLYNLGYKWEVENEKR